MFWNLRHPVSVSRLIAPLAIVAILMGGPSSWAGVPRKSAICASYLSQTIKKQVDRQLKTKAEEYLRLFRNNTLQVDKIEGQTPEVHVSSKRPRFFAGIEDLAARIRGIEQDVAQIGSDGREIPETYGFVLQGADAIAAFHSEIQEQSRRFAAQMPFFTENAVKAGTAIVQDLAMVTAGVGIIKFFDFLIPPSEKALLLGAWIPFVSNVSIYLMKTVPTYGKFFTETAKQRPQYAFRDPLRWRTVSSFLSHPKQGSWRYDTFDFSITKELAEAAGLGEDVTTLALKVQAREETTDKGPASDEKRLTQVFLDRYLGWSANEEGTPVPVMVVFARKSQSPLKYPALQESQERAFGAQLQAAPTP